MTTLAPSRPVLAPDLPSLAGAAPMNPPLLVAGLVVLAAGAVLSLGLLLDARTLHGLSVWTKPVKFHLSVSLYFLTLLWVSACLPERVRSGWFVSAISALAIAAGTAELLYIDIQAARGLDSHFNETTPFYTLAFRTMGVVAVVLTAVSLGFAWMVARHGNHRLSPALRDAVALGLVLTFVLGAGAGAAMGANGAHAVGGTPEAAGMPLFGWSRDGGDLRVAHFLGMHAIQAIPVAGFILAMLAPPRLARVGVWGFAALYTALTGWTLAEALSGHPFLPGLF